MEFLKWKNIKPQWDAISALPESDEVEIIFDDKIEIYPSGLSKEDENYIYRVAKMILPWRKGPFQISKTFIDSEWRSNIKYNLLKPHFNLKNKIVGDIGCNNGYYLFRMIDEKPKRLIGFDPSPTFFCQFKFLNHFIKSDVKFELLGVENVENYKEKFDVLFCLGVLYHRQNPIGSLKSLYKGLNFGGELFLDTFIIDGEDEMALTPRERYSKIPNIYFIPTVNALKNWCYRVGFEDFEILKIMKTESKEQRKTEWIIGQSLNDFLDKNDRNKTVEGYPAPKRVYIKVKKNKKNS